MLDDIANALKRVGSGVDFIEEDHAKRAIEAALSTIRASLEAIMAQVYYLVTRDEPEPGPLQRTRSVPHFRRFKSVFDEEFIRKHLQIPSAEEVEKNSTVESWEFYNLETSKGVWTWLWEKTCPVWISNTLDEESRGNRSHLVNEANEAFNLPSEHFVFFDATRSIISIPFKHKIEQSSGTWGFLDIEFDRIYQFNKEQYEVLQKLSDRVADIIWKYRAWEENRKGTNAIVTEFKATCKELQKGGLLVKTGLFVPFTGSSQYPGITKIVEQAFGDARIRLISPQRPAGSSPGEWKRNEHFGVLDITQGERNALVLLGAMLSQEKPCLVLVEHGDESELPWLVEELARSRSEDISRTVHLYRYDKTEEGLKFLDPNGAEKDWADVWSAFVTEVGRSPAFRTARDWYPEESLGTG